MTEDHAARAVMETTEFAHLGEGEVAYLRELKSEELPGLFPNVPRIAPGVTIWALINASGAPILLADSRDVAVAGALENELTTVSVH
ncbi:BQ00720 family protein [Prosthecodimorpha hirschii]|jgi:hypothetical protein|uniref:BQ00720 family protein n=1 Tax=Prosthecodimorpha hirschii TaxID=665126 RepID=UPI0015E4726B|nr:DUF1150 family protein [Prosthecomicrobium hirschii]